MTARKVAILVKGYPRLSETFIAQELLGLQQAGLDFDIVSLRHPTDTTTHDLNRRITASVLYLPEYLGDEPARVARAALAALARPARLWRTLKIAWTDYRRDKTRNRLRRLGQAFVLARELPPGTAHLHAHYLHTPSSVARYTALLTGLGWSFSAHAKDIWTTPAWDLRDKLAEAAWGATCTAANHDFLSELSDRPETVRLIYHGLDFSRFPDAPVRPPRTGRDPDDPLRLLTIGRAVEKKGIDILLKALAGLPADLHWRLTHIGGGEQLTALQALAGDLGLADRIEWRGPQTQDAVIDALAQADLFVLAAIIARGGDRDGLPNVLMEAQAMGLPCLASNVSAIPELIVHDETGILVEPGDEQALTQAIEGLAADPDKRARLAAAGSVRVRREFGFSVGLNQLAGLFGLAPAEAPQPDEHRLAS